MTRRTTTRRDWFRSTLPLCLLAVSVPKKCAAEGLIAAVSREISPLTSEHRGPVIKAMAVDRNGQQLAIAGDDNSIRILDAETLLEQRRLLGHRDLIRSLAFDPRGETLVSAGNDGRLVFWNCAEGWEISHQVEGLPAIFDVQFSPAGGQLAAVGFETGLLLFTSQGEKQSQVNCHCRDLRGLAFPSDGLRVAVVGRSGMLHLFNPRSGAEIGEFPLHGSRIRDIAILPEGDHVVTVGEDGAVIVFDLSSYEVVQQINLLPCKLFAVAAIDRSTVAVAGSDNRIRIVDCAAGRVRAMLDGHAGSVCSLVYLRGLLYSGGFDTTVRKWTLPGGKEERLASEVTGADKR